MDRNQQMKIDAVRDVAGRVLEGEATQPALVLAAQDTVQTMRREAAEHGLTTADVVRAVLLPVLEKNQGCDCHSCKARRSRFAQALPRHDSTLVS